MEPAPSIQLIQATVDDYPTIQNMARFYIYDRTAFMGWECPEDGLFECIDFKHYFDHPCKKAFLVRVSGEIAGFALLDKELLIEPIDWNMGEFFILAKFQGKGIANVVAQEILRRHAGRWAVAAMSENIKAVKFWRKTIAKVSHRKYREILKTADDLRTLENPEPCSMNIFIFEVE